MLANVLDGYVVLNNIIYTTAQLLQRLCLRNSESFRKFHVKF